MDTLLQQITRAEHVFERTANEEKEQARSELIELASVVEEARFRSLRGAMSDIEQLAEKISIRGQLVPILVWLKRGSYVLLSGHRRVAAMRLIGESRVKAIVYNDRDLSTSEALDIAIDDNIDRDNFSKVELAALVARMVGEGMTQRQLAKRLRLSNGSVSDYFRLSKTAQDVRDAVDSGRVAVRAGLRLATEPEELRLRVLGDDTVGMLSLGDVTRLIASAGDVAPAESQAIAVRVPSARSRRGAAWSREASLLAGLAWQRKRGDDREIRVRLPKAPTDEQRVELRKFLLEQIRKL